jgi:homogentisate phytyltransferase / homogentisate geranylgeranyltransferase
MSSVVLSKRWRQTITWLRVLWKFSRPHTIIGTSLSVTGLAMVALASTTVGTTFSWLGFGGAIAAALVPSLCANLYIVGLNQLEDVDIDRINKPNLPLASGEFSRKEGLLIVWITGALALILSALQGTALWTTVILSVAIGTIYSLPPFRLKRFPFWAALCIFGVRGIIVNLGFFLHFQQVLGGTQRLSAEVWALTGFVILFAFAIAIFKDIPDAEGDRQFKINTLTIRLGTQSVFDISRWVLIACYGLMIGATALGLIAVQPIFLIATQLGLMGWLWVNSTKVNLKEKRQISQFYQFIWKLFFLEYILFPLACLWKS